MSIFGFFYFIYYIHYSFMSYLPSIILLYLIVNHAGETISNLFAYLIVNL